jgi:tetratricopeptide (TPR) repeat protein
MADFIPHEAPVKDIKDLPLLHPGKPAGREDVLREVYNHLRGGQAVLLYGKAGIGKTALAATLAAAYTQPAGGVLWVDTGADQFAALLARVGRAYRLTDVTTSENPVALTGTVAAALIQHRPFIVVDNVTGTAAIKPFVEKCAAGLPLLILSETLLEGPWQPVALPPLEPAAAVVLFKQKAGINDATQDAAIAGIARLLEQEPLPLVMAARGMFAAKQNAAVYLKTLQQVAQSTGGSAAVGTLAASYRTLNNALQGLILMLGATFRGEGSAELLAQISGVPVDTINQTMTILSQLYLVEKFERYGQPYYRMHPFVHEFARNALKGSNRLETLQQKVQETVLAYARKYSALGAAGHSALALEMDTFLATAAHAAGQGEREVANTLLLALTGAGGFVQTRGYVYELLQLRSLGSGSTSAFPAYGPEPVASPETMLADLMDVDDTFDTFDDDFEDDDDAEAARLTTARGFDDDDDFFDDGEAFEDVDDDEALPVPSPNLGRAPAGPADAPDDSEAGRLRTDQLNSVDVDRLRLALNQAKQQRDLPRQLQILKAVGKVLVQQNKPTEAITSYNEILTLYETINDDEGTLETLDMLSALLVKNGESHAAVMHATRGLQLAEASGDAETRLHLLLTLGDARQDLGESEAAAKAFSLALEIARKTDDRQNEALALYKLGFACLDNDDAERAVHAWEQARELFKTQGKRNFEGRVLGALGTAYSDMQRWSEAIRYFKSSLHIAREVQDRAEEALQLSNLGQAQVEARQLPDALLSFRQTLHLAYESDSREDIVSAIVDLVGLMFRSNRLLSICELLLQDAVALEPNDRDVNRLIGEIARRKLEVEAQGISQTPINGSARQYAANAYALLEA